MCCKTEQKTFVLVVAVAFAVSMQFNDDSTRIENKELLVA